MSTKDVKSAQKALIASGFVVFLQFAFFLFIGVMLWAFYNGVDPVKDLKLGNKDELFGYFIVNSPPSGLSGFVIAGILAAALSSSLGALASSTVTDVYERIRRTPMTDDERLRHGRIWTLVWAGLLIVCAGLFASSNKTTADPIVVQALGIAGYTYGALLGAFLLGLIFKRVTQVDAIIAFVSTVLVVGFVILGVKFAGSTPTINFGKATADLKSLTGWWNTPLGVAVTLLVGGLLSLRRSRGVAVRDELDVKAES
jgi:Na+/proline symporter